MPSTYPFDLSVINAKPPSRAFEEARKFKVSNSRSVNVDLDEMRGCLAEGE